MQTPKLDWKANNQLNRFIADNEAHYPTPRNPARVPLANPARNPGAASKQWTGDPIPHR